MYERVLGILDGSMIAHAEMVARKANGSKGSVYNFLKVLGNAGLLDPKKLGNRTFYKRTQGWSIHVAREVLQEFNRQKHLARMEKA